MKVREARGRSARNTATRSRSPVAQPAPVTRSRGKSRTRKVHTMKVRDLMCEDVRTCMPHESLSLAAQQMWDGDCGTLPVIDEERRVVGMITDRDICMALFLNGQTASAIAVRDVMSSKVHHCRPEDDIDHPLEIMRKQRVRRLPVVDEEGVLCAVLSINDLVLAAGDSTQTDAQQVSCSALLETLKGVCEHTGAEVPVS